MNIGGIFALEPGTVSAGRRCFNLLVRAVILAFTLLLLVALHLGLSFLIGWFSDWFGVDEKTKMLLSSASLVYVIVVSLAAVFMSVVDVFKLVVNEYLNRGLGDGREQNGQQGEGEGQPAPR